MIFKKYVDLIVDIIFFFIFLNSFYFFEFSKNDLLGSLIPIAAVIFVTLGYLVSVLGNKKKHLNSRKSRIVIRSFSLLTLSLLLTSMVLAKSSTTDVLSILNTSENVFVNGILIVYVVLSGVLLAIYSILIINDAVEIKNSSVN